MDSGEKGNDKTVWLIPQVKVSVTAKQGIPFYKLDTRGIKEFFDFTGGSIFYCLSAVFVIYGIVNVMGPMLSKGEALKNALPCILTLHAYELALLGVLILIVSKKVVDDAISVLLIMALFLVGTSVALGSAADTGIRASVWLGFLGIVLAFIKFLVMRRFAATAFKFLSILGLIVIIACNYLGPAFMANTVLAGQTLESSRRGHWWLIWLVMLIGAGLVVIEAMRGKPREKTPFLQTPVMVYIFSLVVIAASGAHQYAMAYANGLERVIGDYVPIAALSTLLVIEIMRLWGKQFGFLEAVISCAPLAVTMFAIEEKAVLSNSDFGFALLGYPPAILALTGAAIACSSLYHRRYKMLAVAVFYGLGVILTFGFSPEHPYDLNYRACLGTLVVTLLIYGVIKRSQYLCIAAVIALCIGLSQWKYFEEFTKSYQLTMAGGLAGVFGLWFAVLFIIFGSKMDNLIRIIGAFCLMVFLFDYMPKDFDWRYAIALAGIVLLAIILWYRAKNILVLSLLLMPFFIKIYIASRYFAYWRAVIVGFLLLGAGVVASLFKRRMRDRISHQTNDAQAPSGSP